MDLTGVQSPQTDWEAENLPEHMQPSIFPLQVSQKSTSRVRTCGTVCNGPEASGERLFLQGT